MVTLPELQEAYLNWTASTPVNQNNRSLPAHLSSAAVFIYFFQIRLDQPVPLHCRTRSRHTAPKPAAPPGLHTWSQMKCDGRDERQRPRSFRRIKGNQFIKFESIFDPSKELYLSTIKKVLLQDFKSDRCLRFEDKVLQMVVKQYY